MKTILITGANGFVSWFLIRDLLQQPYKIIATGKGPSRLPFNHTNLLYQTLDFTRPEDVQIVFERHKPEIVVHTGAMSKPDECELDQNAALLHNVHGTEHLLHAAARYKSYFLFLSSDFVFEGKSLCYKEDDTELHPVNYYGQTKKLAEELVRRYPFKWSVVRTILVYGKPMSGRQNILTIVADALKRSTPYKVFSDQTRMPTYVEDLAAAMAAMIDKQSIGIFHISGNEVLRPYEMACAVAQRLHYDEKLIEEVTAETFKQPAARPPVTGFDLTKATTELSYKPTSFAEGLQKTFEA